MFYSHTDYLFNVEEVQDVKLSWINRNHYLKVKGEEL